MAATIPEIMTGIETRLKTIDGLRTADHALGDPVAPAAFPLVPAFNYRATMGRGTYVIALRVAIVVASQLDRVGQHLLAEFASQDGVRSVRAAIEGDKTLGGLVNQVTVESFDPDGLVDVGLAGYVGGIFNLSVIASGV